VGLFCMQESFAVFYTLVSEGTREMDFCAKRQEFLVNQGYAFDIKRDVHLNAQVNADTPTLGFQQLHVLFNHGGAT
jgi:hypothetical protein